MEKIDSFMMSSEQSKQMNSQNENVMGINNQNRTMTLSKKLHREESRPLYETTLIATRGLMNPQDEDEDDAHVQIQPLADAELVAAAENGDGAVEAHESEPAPSASG